MSKMIMVINYSFLKNKAYTIPEPDGLKQQFTVEQVKTALEHATGKLKLYILCGLNVGMTEWDVRAITPEKIQGNHFVSFREKLEYKKTKVIGKWLLWGETMALLKEYGAIKTSRLARQYTAFVDYTICQNTKH